MRPSTWLKISGIVLTASLGVAFAAHAEAGLVAPPAQHHRQAQHDGNAASGASAARPAAPSASAPASRESVLAARLPVANLAGQRVIYSYQGLTPPARLLRLIRHGDVAGVIFFASNYASRSQFAAAIAALNAANAIRSNPVRGYPLLLMTDQEGGYVKRLPGAPYRSEKQIGALPAAAPASTCTASA